MAGKGLEQIIGSFGDPGKCQMIIWFLLLGLLFHVGMIQQFNIIISYRPPHACKITNEIQCSSSDDPEVIYDSTPKSYLATSNSTTPFPEATKGDFANESPDNATGSKEGSWGENLTSTGASTSTDRDGWLIDRRTNISRSCKTHASSCSVVRKNFQNSNSSEIFSSCSEGWNYEGGELYPANEFDLVCDRSKLLNLMVSLTFVGVMIGGFGFGYVADNLGRRPTMAGTLFAISCLSVGIYFSEGYVAFAAFRFLLGILNQGLQTTAMTYNSELFLPRMRTLTSSAVGFMWACILPLLALLFYVTANWRQVHLIMGALSFVSVLYVWFIPESVRWLLTKGKTKEASDVLARFARFNGIPPLASLQEDLEVESQVLKQRVAQATDKPVTLMSMVKNRVMRRITCLLLFVWFTNAFVVFGLSFGITELKMDKYISFAVCGVIEVLTRLAALYFLVRFGRIRIIFSCLILCGLLSVSGFMLVSYLGDVSPACLYVGVAAALIARNLIAVNFTITIIYTSEIFPTTLRSTGVGAGFSLARLGNILTPFIPLLGTTWKPLPQLIYGSLAIIAALVALMLPETHNQPMPNSVRDVENLMMKSRSRQKVADVTNGYPLKIMDLQEEGIILTTKPILKLNQ